MKEKQNLWEWLTTPKIKEDGKFGVEPIVPAVALGGIAAISGMIELYAELHDVLFSQALIDIFIEVLGG